jgi:hypothetical protein
MVSAMEAVRDSEGDAAHAAETSVVLTEIAALRQEVVALREQLGSVPVPRSGR